MSKPVGFKVVLVTEDGELIDQWHLQRGQEAGDDAWLADDATLPIRSSHVLGEEIRDQINIFAWRKS